SLHFLISSSPCFFQRTRSQNKNSASPAEYGSRPPPSFFGLSAASALAPLAVGSRLSTTQAKKLLRYRFACFLPAPFRLKAALPVLGLNPASPTHSPRPPTPKEMQLNFSV
ncbi:MAG TPA: hypothetical protein PK740_05605, partial [Bacteroidales bacterium]|nr:hypothetical protein [Bacteroidales bacterium]